jgi:hypothetical protein
MLSRSSRSTRSSASPLKQDGYQKILSYSAYTGATPDHKKPLPNTIHTCYMIEKECIKAGYAFNIKNLPFKSFCGHCKEYKDALQICFARIDPTKSQWENGHVYRCI